MSLILAVCLIRQRKLNNKLTEEKKKDLSQRKSREVILGQTAEKLAPFLDDFKFDPQKCQFLGQPIDYIVFDDTEVVFLEVKSGKAQLNSKQRKIKKLIKEKNVRWEEYRI